MVTTTGTLVPMGVPSALAGSVRSARSLTPSDIGMARSLIVVVPGYCSGRGFHALAGVAVVLVLVLMLVLVPAVVAAWAGAMASGAATRAEPAASVVASRTSGRSDM